MRPADPSRLVRRYVAAGIHRWLVAAVEAETTPPPRKRQAAGDPLKPGALASRRATRRCRSVSQVGEIVDGTAPLVGSGAQCGGQVPKLGGMKPGVAAETAYYFNRNLLVVALIMHGVRFPAGTWLRVVNANAQRPQVEQMLTSVFPDLKGKVLTFVTLASEAEVQDFERSLGP